MTQAVHEHCAPHGLTWPVDFASKGSSTVGGNIATNAGGVKVIRYGLTRQWVLGSQVVLASGEVLELNGALEKNNTGLDLRQLFIGSEGTLGIVTEATLKLARLPARLDVLLFAVRGSGRACCACSARRARAPFTISRLRDVHGRVPRARGPAPQAPRARSTAPSTHYVLVELEDAAARGPRDLGRSRSSSARSSRTACSPRTWSRRATSGRCAKASASRSRATGFPTRTTSRFPSRPSRPSAPSSSAVFARRYPGWEVCVFGHIGDGNLHVNVMKPDGMEKAAFLAQDPRGRPRSVRPREEARRQHQRGARHRPAQEAVASLDAVRGRQGHDAGHQAGARPGRHVNPARSSTECHTPRPREAVPQAWCVTPHGFHP